MEALSHPFREDGLAEDGLADGSPIYRAACELGTGPPAELGGRGAAGGEPSCFGRRSAACDEAIARRYVGSGARASMEAGGGGALAPASGSAEAGGSELKRSRSLASEVAMDIAAAALLPSKHNSSAADRSRHSPTNELERLEQLRALVAAERREHAALRDTCRANESLLAELQRTNAALLAEVRKLEEERRERLGQAGEEEEEEDEHDWEATVDR